jgi:hypothetical protein
MASSNYLIPNQNNMDSSSSPAKKIDPSNTSSYDIGYDSLLSTSANSTCSFLHHHHHHHSNTMLLSTSTQHDSVLDKATTPDKTEMHGFTFQFSASKSPDLKHSYVADVDSIYLASIKSATASNSESSLSLSSLSTASPFKSTSNSPKFIQPTSTFISERDNFKSKLLRSPAFKINGLSPYLASPRHHPYDTKPHVQVSSFSSRLSSYVSSLATTPTITTSTETDFLQFLIKDKLVPENPNQLIGRHMGIDHLDILSELSAKNMHTPVLEKIFSYLSVKDLVSVGCVSKSWRNMLKIEYKNLYSQRANYIKIRKNSFEKSKENRSDSTMSNDYANLTMEQKRNLFKNSGRSNHTLTKEQNDDQTATEDDVWPRNQNGSLVFTSLDMNCLFNTELNKSTQSLLNASNISSSTSSITTLQQKKQKMMMATHKAQSMLETMTNQQANPDFIHMIHKLSPKKTTSPIKSSAGGGSINKIDLIGSKKSKRNLKRL